MIMADEIGALSTRELNPLSIDVRYLGGLLGQVIKEQHGDDAYQLVEEVRALAKARRAGDAGAAARLSKLIEEMDLPRKRILVKAFSNYFQLINIAEDLQRIRKVRERELGGVLGESTDEAVGLLRAAGMSAAEVRALLERIDIRLVLTAHPSEAKRKEVLVKLRHIAAILSVKDRQPGLLPREIESLSESVLEAIEELWQTRPTRASRATVSDEVDFGVYFLTNSIMDVVVDLYDDLRRSLRANYPSEDWDDLPPLLRFASWIGGDRDGNPNVTPEVTLNTLVTLHAAVKELYLRDLHRLTQHLTHSADETPVTVELKEAVVAVDGLDDRFSNEFYRMQAGLIRGRLERDEYESAADLLDDLRLIEDSLRQYGGIHSGRGYLRRLVEKVRLFGLHLVPLDIREDSRLIAAALEEVFHAYGRSGYRTLPETERQQLLTAELNSPRPLFPVEPKFSDATNRIIATFRMIAEAHRKYGPVVIDTFIASMSQQPSDVLAMLVLAQEVGVDQQLDIVPLFETIDDLDSAPGIMETLFQNPAYRSHLAKRGMRQQIMIGYSDSGKDGGYLASNWFLYGAQQRLSEACKQHGVTLQLFHGRGGSIGRGGGPTNQSILSQPAGSLHGAIKITEQGEVIAYRYSNMEIARRHLHHVAHAVLVAMGAPLEREVRPEWRAAMNDLAERGRKAFRAFVYEDPTFIEYWQQATPINELADLPISSRPARRRSGGSFADVRAIPWMFSWMQSRAILPSWYGVGSALDGYCQSQPDGLATLRSMYKEWPFFKALIENAQLDIAKADMGIAELYAGLVQDRALAARVFGQMQAEHTLATRMVCAVLEQTSLLEKASVMQRSIERRNPYVDPLNFIQVDLLRLLRATPPDSPDYRPILRAVLSTINGISAGMKVTG
jgi:phosphoenolpyruvate carboxylase